MGDQPVAARDVHGEAGPVKMERVLVTALIVVLTLAIAYRSPLQGAIA